MDGPQLYMLARSPDTVTLLNRLGITRIKDVLKFQRLLGVLRPGTHFAGPYSRPIAFRNESSTQQLKETSAAPPTPTTNAPRSVERSLSPPAEANTHAISFQSLALMSDGLNDKSISNMQ